MAVWDTSTLPEADQFEYYQQVICRAFVPLLPIPVGRPEGFASRIQTRALGALNRASVGSPIQATHHGSSEVSATAEPYYFVNLQLQGRCRAKQGAADSVVEPGQFTVLDTTRPFYLDFDRDWRMLSFRVPHEHLDEHIRGVGIPLGAPIGRSGAAAAAIALIRALWSMGGEVPVRASEELALSFSSAVAAALTERSFDAAELQPVGMRALIVRYLGRHLSDPALSVDSVSRVFGVSPRTLHSAFEGERETFAAALRSMRMRRAAELLADGRGSVTAVGEAVGYPDPSSFGRAFRRFHGASPREFRALRELQSSRARMA
ncbi:AraC family transcriptional regulator [Gulosibacter sp. 10]|uniref:AraC family transcriptional regulator n=1 Tax=Gulosibacter sp. 10 TaxID=1255570 RepID=UPI00097EC7D9|nr:AraC family transcriptional regulator [Gulosibacter sp. 10]SJM70077.1 Transcriptional regulator, AraC family [Gulosibacter sp. 10]